MSACTADGKRISSMQHAKHRRSCPFCQRVIAGNGFYRHFEACKRRHVSPEDEARALRLYDEAMEGSP